MTLTRGSKDIGQRKKFFPFKSNERQFTELLSRRISRDWQVYIAGQHQALIRVLARLLPAELICNCVNHLKKYDKKQPVCIFLHVNLLLVVYKHPQ